MDPPTDLATLLLLSLADMKKEEINYCDNLKMKLNCLAHGKEKKKVWGEPQTTLVLHSPITYG